MPPASAASHLASAVLEFLYLLKHQLRAESTHDARARSDGESNIPTGISDDIMLRISDFR